MKLSLSDSTFIPNTTIHFKNYLNDVTGVVEVLEPAWYRNEIKEKTTFNMQKYISVKLACTTEV